MSLLEEMIKYAASMNGGHGMRCLTEEGVRERDRLEATGLSRRDAEARILAQPRGRLWDYSRIVRNS